MKNKIAHFAENKSFENLFQFTYPEIMKGFEFKGKWNQGLFKNENPIIIEVGCGKGEYTIGQARMFPDKNFIGLDIKGARLWRGCKISNDEGMKNVAFIRSKIELSEYYFDKNEVDEIWITFPDPQPKEFKAKKRLISPRFLELYRNYLQPEGIIHLKTDNTPLFDYTLKLIKEEKHHLIYETRDLYNARDYSGVANLFQTFYERQFLEQGMKINYLKFKLND